MDFLKERMNAISDGIMAILITIMVFNIPIPNQFNDEAIVSLLINIGVFFISFLIIGTQWVKHCQLFKVCSSMNERILWINILYLACLSLMPIFTKWIMMNPKEVVTVIGYDIVFFMVTSCYHILQKAVFRANVSNQFIQKMKNRKLHKGDQFLFAMSTLIILTIFVSSFFYPTVSLVFFVAFPIIPSIHSMIDVNHDERQLNRIERQKKLPLQG